MEWLLFGSCIIWLGLLAAYRVGYVDGKRNKMVGGYQPIKRKGKELSQPPGYE